MTRPIAAVLVLLAGSAAALAQDDRTHADNNRHMQSPASQGSQLPIRAITLYRSGVGSFQLSGPVADNEPVQLRFNTGKINDILKSMVVLDLSGQGQIEGVRYASKEPLDRRLASFGVDISGSPSLVGLLSQLRGSRAQLRVADATLSGVIVGVETRHEAQGQAQEPVEVDYVTLLTDDAGIVPVSMRHVTSVKLEDPRLQEELSKALAALAEHRADRSKVVEIASTGPAGRELAVTYVHEMPVWKVSYRLVLPELTSAAPQAKGAKGSVQGWAIVENTTDSDWNDVRLSLVSGRPVSFTMDLYQPLFIARPLVPVPQIAGVMPREYELDTVQTMYDAMPIPGGQAAASPRPGAKLAREMIVADQSAQLAFSSADMANYAARARALAQESGEVFQFTLQTPVTIERQRSAMLPIINQGIEARRVAIYNPSDGGNHPMRGVELVNDTGLQLLPGPVSVFDGSVYAGDAQVGHVSPGDTRLLAYAVDLETAADRKENSAADVLRIRIVNGLLEQSVKHRRSVTYQFTSKDQARGRRLIIEHPRDGSLTLVEPARPASETPASYRFELMLDAGKAASLPVVEERTELSTLALLDFNAQTLLLHARNGKASEGVVQAFRDAQQKRAAVRDAERRVAELERERAAISQDQDRIRSNMNTVDRASQLYTRYMTKLTEQETRLEALVEAINQGKAEAAALQKALNDFLGTLSVE